MAEIKWIKLATDFFEDRKIKQIRARQDGDAILLIWINLLVLAGLVNDGGLVYLTQGVPYTEEMLAEETKRDLSLVRAALDLFRSLHMIEDTPDGLLISNWEKHQDVEGMERVREQAKLRMRNYRERKRNEVGQKEDRYATVTQPVTLCNTDVTVQNKNIEEDIRYRNVSFSDENDCRTELRQIADKWNELGVSPVKKISSSSSRGKMLCARVREYGLDVVLQAIDNIKQSPFLRGENSHGWMITLDWFAKPNNFIKVSEGQYDRNKPQRKAGPGRESSVDRLARLVREGAFDE